MPSAYNREKAVSSNSAGDWKRADAFGNVSYSVPGQKGSTKVEGTGIKLYLDKSSHAALIAAQEAGLAHLIEWTVDIHIVQQKDNEEVTNSFLAALEAANKKAAKK